MRKLFVIVLVALLLGVGVVALIETDPGYVLVSYGNYTLETSLWVGLLVLLLLLLLFIWCCGWSTDSLAGSALCLPGWDRARRSSHAAEHAGA